MTKFKLSPLVLALAMLSTAAIAEENRAQNATLERTSEQASQANAVGFMEVNESLGAVEELESGDKVTSVNAQALSSDGGAEISSENRIVAETVVVTASRMQQDLLDTNSSVSVVSVKRLANAAVDNVPDMLRQETGVRLLTDGTPGLKRIALRGENASRTLVMVDNQRIDDQKNKSGVPFLINPYFIERIEVVKGPSSVLYGSDALGGIVNVISKQPSQKPELEAGLTFNGAANGFTEYVNFSGTEGPFKAAVGAFNTNQGDIYLSGRERLDNTSYSSHGANGYFGYDLNDKVTIAYTFEHFDLDAETATTLNDAVYGNYRADMPEWSRLKQGLELTAVNINDYLARFNTSIYYQTNDKVFNSWPQRGLVVGVDNEQRTLGGNLQLEWSLSDTFYLITGYDGRQEKMQSSSDVQLAMGPVNGSITINDNDYAQQHHALYALLSTYITDELTLNTGVRYNYIKTEAGNTQVSGMINAAGHAVPINMHPDYDDTVRVKTIGSAGLVYRPFDYGAFRLNWSQGFRVPNIQELFLITSTGTLQSGNPNLKPEESDNYELGFRWEDPSGLMTDIALFYTQADNYIETAQDGQFFTYQNIAQADSYGVEAAVAYLMGHFEPYANVTWMEREYKTASGSSKNTGTPKFSGSGGLRYYGQYFKADGYINFATETKNDNLDGSSYFGSNRWGGYITYNLSISTDFGTKDRYIAFASVENLFDKSYQTSELIHEPGRFFTLGVKGRF